MKRLMITMVHVVFVCLLTPYLAQAQIVVGPALRTIVDRQTRAVDKEVQRKNRLGKKLLQACAKGDLAKVKQLIEQEHLSVNRYVRAPDNKTPLMLAAENGHADVVRYLISKGANIRAITKSGKTALDLAKQNKHTDIVKLLESQLKGFIDSPIPPAVRQKAKQIRPDNIAPSSPSCPSDDNMRC